MTKTEEAQIARVNELVARWNIYRGKLPVPDRFCQLKADLYQVRNAGWNGNPPISVWPGELIDADDGIMAAVEHYFLCRCWVGTGAYPKWQLRSMNLLYNAGKVLGITPRHNPTKPTTPVSSVQLGAQEAGIRDGANDLAASGKSAPMVTKPPKYW